MVEIRIEGPGKNALGTELMGGLVEQMAAAGDAPLLFTGAGDAFSAGLDLKEVYDADIDRMRLFLQRLTQLLEGIATHPAPVVAAINGHAIAGGCLVALAADHRVVGSDPRIRIGLNEVALGLRFPPRMLRLVEARISRRHLHQVLLGAGLHGPQDAVRLGLADTVAEDPVAAGKAVLKTLSSYPREAYVDTRRHLNRFVDSGDSEDEARFESEILPLWIGEGIKGRVGAFLGKR